MRRLSPPAPLWLSGYFPGGIGNNQSGFIGGGQVGYNWQTGALVFGAEADFDGTTLSKTYNYTSTPFGSVVNGVALPAALLNDTLSVHAKASLDWLGTVRGRVGFVATPDNRLMIYGTGGFAYAGGSSNFNVYDATGLYLERQSELHADRVDDRRRRRIRHHEQHHDQGRISLRRPWQQNHHDEHAQRPGARRVYATAKINYNASIVRAGINYKF